MNTLALSSSRSSNAKLLTFVSLAGGLGLYLLYRNNKVFAEENEEQQEAKPFLVNNVNDPRVQPFLAKILAEGGVPDNDEPWYDHKNNFLYDTLAKEHLFENYIVYLNKEKKTCYAIVTYGDHMCGHPGVAHGGSTAAMLDQFFGILFATLAPRGFTANLNINYRKPVLANHTFLVKGELVKKENRKYYMKATMVDEDDVVYAEATSLYIQSDVKKVIETMKEQESAH